MQIVGGLNPIGVQLAVLQHAVLLNGVIAGFFRQQSFGQNPQFFRMFAVGGIGDDHIGGQAMGEGSHFAGGAAGRGLAGQRKRTVARLGNLAGQQVQIIDQLIGPDTAYMLIEAHGPERHQFTLGIGIEFGQGLQLADRHAGNPRRFLGGIGRDELGIVIEIGRGRIAGIFGVLGLHFQFMVGAQAIADIGDSGAEVDVLFHKGLIVGPLLNDVIGDVIGDGQIAAGFEDDGQIGQIGRAVFNRGHHHHLDMGSVQAAVGHPAPQDRVHFGHVRSPQHEAVGLLEIVVAAHGFVHAEGAHEGIGRRGHAMAGIGVQIVGAESGAHQLGGGVTFPHRPLPRPEHAHRSGALGLQCRLPFLGHDGKGLVPRDGGKRAVFVVCAVGHAQ